MRPGSRSWSRACCQPNLIWHGLGMRSRHGVGKPSTIPRRRGTWPGPGMECGRGVRRARRATGTRRDWSSSRCRCPGSGAKTAPAAGRGPCAQPPRSGAGQPDHRRLDLPGEPGSLLHPSVPGGLPRRVSPAVEDPAAGDPRRLRAEVRRLVPRARDQGEVQPHPLSGLRRLARSRLARLVETGARGQPGSGPDDGNARLGHPSRDRQPHLGRRHQDGPSLPRNGRRTSWRTGAGARASRPTSLATT